MKKPRQASLSDTVYDHIKTDIFDFQLLPGERFSENELAARFGFSRTPVREALLRLAREGYIEVSHKSGWNVKELNFDQIEELYEVRIELEMAAVRKLCREDAEPNLSLLSGIWLVSAAERLRDWQHVGRLDEAFHAGLVAAAGNREMARIHGEVTERIRIVRRLDFTKPERIDFTYEEHARILQAILHSDSEQAQQLLCAHIEVSAAEVRTITLHMLHTARSQLSS